MARIMGKFGTAKVVALTAADVLTMTTYDQCLLPTDREVAATAAMAAWGLSGVGVRHGENWDGVLLITTAAALPRRHPLARGGVGENRAALLIADIALSTAPLVLSKRLCGALCHRLRGRAIGVEAQAASRAMTATPLTPTRSWLGWMGFQPMRYPANHYYLNLADTVPWLEQVLRRYPRLSPSLSASNLAASQAVNTASHPTNTATMRPPNRPTRHVGGET